MGFYPSSVFMLLIWNTVRLICFFLYSLLEFSPHPCWYYFLICETLTWFQKSQLYKKIHTLVSAPSQFFLFLTSFLPIISKLSNLIKVYLFFPFWVFSWIEKQTMYYFTFFLTQNVHAIRLTWMNYSLFTHSPMSWHIDCLQYFAVTNSATTMNSLMCMYFYTIGSIS